MVVSSADRGFISNGEALLVELCSMTLRGKLRRTLHSNWLTRRRAISLSPSKVFPSSRLVRRHQNSATKNFARAFLSYT